MSDLLDKAALLLHLDRLHDEASQDLDIRSLEILTGLALLVREGAFDICPRCHGAGWVEGLGGTGTCPVCRGKR